MMKLIIFVTSSVIFLIAYIIYPYFRINHDSFTPACPSGYFLIGSMTECHPWLTCRDYSDIKYVMFLTQALVKKIYLVKWRDQYFVLSNLTDQLYHQDFKRNIEVLESLSPSNYVVQLIGSCNQTMLFTEYHHLGDALNLQTLLRNEKLDVNNLSTRFKLCINYVSIIHMLHNSLIGTIVMCDSNSLEKTLSQYLVKDNLQLVVNDLDASPVVNGEEGIKCGHRQLGGSFVAPEQLWAHDFPFDDKLMSGYDEKTDIWKIPDVCEWFLDIKNDDEDYSFILRLKTKLKAIHNECKSHNPKQRPSALQVLLFYQSLLNDIES